MSDTSATDEPNETTRSRYGHGSEPCGTCGWPLPRPPHPQVCWMCSTKNVKIEAFSKIELLFLATQLWQKWRTQANEPDAVFMQHVLHNHYVGRHLGGGKYDFDASTPVTTLRDQLSKDAAAWRYAGCPIDR